MLTISCDTSRLDLERPAGPALYATALLDALRATGEVAVAERGQEGAASVILSVDGRFRSGREEGDARSRQGRRPTADHAGEGTSGT